MTLFLLHENTVRQDDKNLICLPDRFNWFAFLLPPIWALSNRLWFVLTAMIVFVLALNVVNEFLNLPMISLYILAIIWLGFEANSIVGNSLSRRGWQVRHPIMAVDRVRAEQRFFARINRQARKTEREKSRMQGNGLEQDNQSLQTGQIE